MLYFFVHLFNGKKWAKSKTQFGENPATMSKMDVLYFGYKYYFKPPEQASLHNIEQHFIANKPKFNSQKDSVLSVSIGGDLMPYELINSKNCQHFWDELGEWFFESDIVTANLETPIDQNHKPSMVPEVMLNDMNFNGSEELFDVFKGKEFDILSIANNHMLDMGESGLNSTMDFLNEREIPFVGGAQKSDSESFRIIEKNGVKIGFLGFTYSMNQYLPIEGKEYLTNYLPLNEPNCNLSTVKTQCSLLKEKGADLLFIHLHHGNAYQKYPCDHSIELFHRLHNECGIDFIAGGHPHNPQPLEEYEFQCPYTGSIKKGFSVYSLGDFVAYDIFKWCMIPQMLKIKISRTESGFEISGIDQKVGFLELDSDYNLRLRHLHNPQLQSSELVESLREYSEYLKLE